MTPIIGQATEWSGKITVNDCKRLGKIAVCRVWAYKESGPLLANESILSLPWRGKGLADDVCAVGRVTSTGEVFPLVVNIDPDYAVVRVIQDQEKINEIRMQITYLVTD